VSGPGGPVKRPPGADGPEDLPGEVSGLQKLRPLRTPRIGSPPAEPFGLTRERLSPIEQLSAQIAAQAGKLEQVLASQSQVVARQSQMALQIDGHGTATREKLSAIHEEMALLRHQLEDDHAPRIAAIEKTTAQKVGGGLLKGTKYGAYAGLAVLVLHGLTQQFPNLAPFIDPILGLIGQ
jgi:hypothetical protein